MFYLGVLLAKKVADETRKFAKERARKPDTTLCGFTKQRLRDFFWLEAPPDNDEESGAARTAIELTEIKPPLKRKKIKVKRDVAVVNNSITTTIDTEKVAKEKDDGAVGGDCTEVPLPIGGSSDEDET